MYMGILRVFAARSIFSVVVILLGLVGGRCWDCRCVQFGELVDCAELLLDVANAGFVSLAVGAVWVFRFRTRGPDCLTTLVLAIGLTQENLTNPRNTRGG